MSDGIRQRLNDAVVRIAGRLANCAAEERLERLKAELKEVPDEIRGAVETLVLLGVSAVQDGGRMGNHRATRVERYALGIGGTALLLLLVAIALWVPNPTASQEKTFTIVLMLAGGAVGALFPGALAVEGKRPGVAVRATGALGLSVFIALVYRFLL